MNEEEKIQAGAGRKILELSKAKDLTFLNVAAQTCKLMIDEGRLEQVNWTRIQANKQRASK